MGFIGRKLVRAKVAPAQPGYYPGYSTLARSAYWDDATRAVVLERVYEVPSFRFFSPYEVPTAVAVFDRLLPQDDRNPALRIPIAQHVDERLYERRLDGYRFEDMPDEPWAHRLGLRGIEAIAHHLYTLPFADLSRRLQEEILDSIREQRPAAGDFIWNQMNLKHYWNLVVQDAAAAYYAHPWAWDEIGFGGPAYPQGYMRLERGLAEPHEVDEQRVAWSPPENSISERLHPEGEQAGGSHGQEGTH